jgi:hypothetical protein
MTYMFELYYAAPADPRKEADLTSRVIKLGGWLDCREDPDHSGPQSVCLTYEFDDLDAAEAAAEALRQGGEHVEGPVEYAAD